MVEYAYDGHDRMVRRHTNTGEVTLFFHDGSSPEIAFETDGAGTVKTRYVLDADGEPVANETVGTGGRGWYIEDPRGNVSQHVDGAGAVKGVFAYDPFGKEKAALTSKAAGWDSRLRFQAAPRDPKTGMYSLGPRLLDPAINRFVGADHYVAAAANQEFALDPMTGNRYLYAGANPANLIDDGHKPCNSKKGNWFQRRTCNLRNLADNPLVQAAATVAACSTGVGCGAVIAFTVGWNAGQRLRDEGLGSRFVVGTAVDVVLARVPIRPLRGVVRPTVSAFGRPLHYAVKHKDWWRATIKRRVAWNTMAGGLSIARSRVDP